MKCDLKVSLAIIGFDQNTKCDKEFIFLVLYISIVAEQL